MRFRLDTALAPLLALVVSGSPSCGPRPDTTPARASGAAVSQSAEDAAEAVTLPVTPVLGRPFERTLSLPGDLLAFQDVAIHARVQGFVEWIGVDRGSVASQGAVLARIVAPELTAQLAEAEARVQSAEAQLLEAGATLASERSTYARLRQASATPGVVAGNDLEVAQQTVEAASARVDALSKNLEAVRQAARSLREVASYLQVAAPFDGVVTERSAHVGSLVGPASGPIVRMQQVSRLRLVAAVPEAYVGGIVPGQPIEFTVTAFPDETFTGKLARAARALDLKTRTMAVELDIANPDGRLAPGMFAEVQWPARRARASLFVPQSAVATTTERTFVIRVRGGVAEWVDVRRGATMNTLVEVFGDLEPGDDVAVRGTDELRAGTPVRAARQEARQP